MSVKIFQIGFNKCGTSTLARFFKRNRLPTVHWAQGDLARRIETAREQGEDPLSFFRDVSFFSDMIALDPERVYEGYKQFDYLYQYYPDSLFILNTRNVDGWIKSRHNHGKLAERFQQALKLESIDAVEQYWRNEWREHHERVLAFFKDKPGQLLVFNIETDDPKELVRFAKNYYKLDVRKFEARNVTAKRPDKRVEKQTKYLAKLGRDPGDALTAEERREWKDSKLDRRRRREAASRQAGKYVVKRSLKSRLVLGWSRAVSAVRRVLG